MILRNIKVLILFIGLLCSFSTQARKYVAIVTKVKGKVTKLNPGAMKANMVKRGDKLYEDTSLVTSKRSFVRIQFLDRSKISLGPNSKLVVTQFKKTKGNVISLLKGRVRTKVPPEKGRDKNKFFIKTRTAALGVRGTEFQTIYNPQNKVTNLLTFEGSVAMANIKDRNLDKTEKVVLKRNNENKVRVEKVEVSKASDDLEKIDQVLEKKEVVVVKAGQFSGTLNKNKKVSRPVKINPQQLGVLYANENLIEKDAKETVVAKDASSVKKYVKLQQAPQAAPPEGFYDKVTGDYAPKSGGFIDLNTGLYIAPEADAKFNEKEQVYVPKKIGKLDVETGEYVAPTGIKLDARKGFVVASKKKETSKVKEELLVATKGLNQSLAKELYVDTDKKEKLPEFIRYSNTELMSKDIFSFYLGGNSTQLDLAPVQQNTEDERLSLEGASELGLVWKMAGNGFLRPVVDFSMTSTSYDNEVRYSHRSNKLFKLGLGAHMYLNSRWNLTADYSVVQENLPSEIRSNSGELYKVSFTSLGLGAEGVLLKTGQFDITTQLKALVNFHKSAAELSIKNGYGFFASLGAGYWYKRNHYFSFNLFNEYRYFDVTRLDVSDSVKYKTVELSKNGLRLQYSYIF